MKTLWDQFEKGRVTLNGQNLEEAFIPRFIGEEAQKAGARFSMADTRKVQQLHDMCSGLCDKVHCAPSEGEASMLGEFTMKAGARHSTADLMQFKAIHDCACALGAKCM